MAAMYKLARSRPAVSGLRALVSTPYSQPSLSIRAAKPAVLRNNTALDNIAFPPYEEPRPSPGHFELKESPGHNC